MEHTYDHTCTHIYLYLSLSLYIYIHIYIYIYMFIEFGRLGFKLFIYLGAMCDL